MCKLTVEAGVNFPDTARAQIPKTEPTMGIYVGAARALFGCADDICAAKKVYYGLSLSVIGANVPAQVSFQKFKKS